MLKNRHNEQSVLNSPFNIETHKETFINYLEIVILKDGTVEYAVPSHQRKVTDILAKQRNITYDEVADLCPRQYYFDYHYWLCRESKTLMVWNKHYIGDPNDAQLQALLELMQAGLFYGKIDIVRSLD